MHLRVGGFAPRFRRDPRRLGIPGCESFEKIDDGGFATIYRAVQRQFGRRVAVKVLDPRGLDKQGLLSRFERECETLGMLGDHPHVVRVFQAGVSEFGSPYIVMEYLPAGSLADRLEVDGPLSWEEVLAIGVRLAGALESAHQAGVLHLDIKPANVLLGPDGEPKLADFGIARVRAALGVTTQTLTLTVGYAAPERFVGDEPIAASDTYSLGATLSTLLVGHLPFLRSRDEQPWPEVVHGRQLYEAVPELDSGLPGDLRAVMRRAMAKKAADRYESAAQLGEALQAVQRQNRLAVTPLLVIPVADIPAPPPPPVRHRRLAMVSLLAVVTLVAGAVIAFVRPSPCARPQADGALSFGTLLPKTGQFLYSGPAMQAGVQLGMKDVNAAGAIPGIVVKLDETNQHDEGDVSANAIRKSTDALLSGGVDVIIGPATSAVAGKVIDKVVCTGVVMFSPSNTSPKFSQYNDHGLYFRAGPSDEFRGPLFGELVVADGNSTTVVMARDDLFGNDFRRLIGQAIHDAGGSVLDSFSYDPNAPNHDGDIQRIKDKDPDAIVLIGFSESASILREMIEQGLGPQNKKVYGGATMSNTLARLVSPQDPGVLAGMKGLLVDDGGEAFVARLKGLDPGLQDVTYAAEAYDTVVVTALAAAVAGTDAPAGIAAQINGVTKGGEKCTSYADCVKLVRERKDIDYDGASGPLEFAEPGEPSSVTYVIYEIKADGSLQPLRTVAAGSAT
ncbi:MAG: bifunctional serine/threonine-protein kinase/ABC transporter substrate-binding protein [Egibacteraceae bacterium]